MYNNMPPYPQWTLWLVLIVRENIVSEMPLPLDLQCGHSTRVWNLLLHPITSHWLLFLSGCLQHV